MISEVITFGYAAFEVPKLPTDPPVRGFPIVLKLLLHDSLPRMFLCPIFCLTFHLNPLSYIIPRDWFAFLGIWGPLLVLRSCFSGSCSTCWWSLDVFVGRKRGVSLSYSSAILGLPLLVILNILHIFPSLCFESGFLNAYQVSHPTLTISVLMHLNHSLLNWLLI